MNGLLDYKRAYEALRKAVVDYVIDAEVGSDGLGMRGAMNAALDRIEGSDCYQVQGLQEDRSGSETEAV